jgi:uncharacterized membrane protein
MSYVPVFRGGRCPQRGLGEVPITDTRIIVDKVLAGRGLDGAALQKVVAAVMSKYDDEMKKQAMQRAAVSTGIALSEIVLACIPVIGWAVGLVIAVVYAVVQAALQTTTSYYKGLSAKVIAETQNELKAVATQYEVKLSEVKNQVIAEETPDAAALALSGVPIPTGQGQLGAWQENLARDLKRAVTATAIAVNPVIKAGHDTFQAVNNVAMKVPIPAVQNLARLMNANDADFYGDIKRAEQKVDNFIEVGTGEAQYKRARDAAAQAKSKALAEFERQFQAASGNVRAPEFRLQLRYALATWIRTNPDIMGMGVVTAPPTSYAGPSLLTNDPSKSLQAVPAVGAAAGAAALLFILGNK